MPITALVAALLLPLYILLTFRVVNLRQSARVAIGDAGDKSLIRRMRVHANFAENVPYALILMGLAESLNASSRLLYVSGACLIIGRLAHAYGVSQAKETFAFRIAGVVLTIAAMVIAAFACAAGALTRY